MRRAFDHTQLDVRTHLAHGLPVHVEHFAISATDNQQRGRVDARQGVIGEIGAATPRYHGMHEVRSLCRSNESGCGPGACAEIPDGQLGDRADRLRPLGCREDTRCQPGNIEAEFSRVDINGFFLSRQQVQ